MLRLVVGLATRAVERTESDHARIVALNAPGRRPEGEAARIRQYAQHRVDVLDLEANRLVSLRLADVGERATDLGIDLFATCDSELADLEIAGRKVFPYVLTFDKLLTETSLVPRMREMLRVLEEAYDNPVDIEFNANFFDEETYTIHLSQCRPLGTRGEGVAVDLPETLEEDRIVVRSRGCVIGRSRETHVDRLIYVVPEAYGQLPVRDRPTVARLLGRLMHLDGQEGAGSIMLVGPGRWGTTTSSLGVPVSFAEINTVSVLGEIVAMREDLVPDVSLGTHFFNEIVELDVLYFACDPEGEGSRLNRGILEGAENRLAELVPGAAKWSKVVRVVDAARLEEIGAMKVNANTPKQALVCYLDGSSS
jgi:pyruvate,water dikinase